MNGQGRRRGYQQKEFLRSQRASRLILEKYPEIRNFILRKERWGYFLMIAGVVVFVLKAVAAISMPWNNIPAYFIAASFAGYWVCFFLLSFSCMARNSKFLFISPVMAGCYFVYNVIDFHLDMQEFAKWGLTVVQFYQAVFQGFPLSVIADVLFAVYILLIFVSSLVLALVPKFRRLIMQYEEMLHILMEKELEEENI